VIDRPPSFLQAAVQEVHLSNLCGGAHVWAMPLAAHLVGRTSTLYDGLAGSVLSGGFMTDKRKLDLYRAHRLEELAFIVLNEAKQEGFIGTVLRRPFRDKVTMSLAVERIVQELQRHAEATNPMLSFIFWNRTRRGVSQIPLAIMAGVPKVHCPYLDRDVFDFLTSVEPSNFLGNRLHDEAIRRAYPQHAELPYEDASKKASYRHGDFAYYNQSVREFWRYLLKDRGMRSTLVRTEYLFPRVLFDRVKRRNQMPWYLTGSVYALELANAGR
jgi:hypothetical protein